MRNLKSILFFFLFISVVELINGQENLLYHFSFSINSKSQLNEITQIISIDNVKDKQVIAYANKKEFAAFKVLNIPYSIITETKDSKAIDMATTIEEISSWDKYPTYELYVQLMESWATNYPELCKLEEIGTLASCRKLLAVKISDNVQNNYEYEPEIFLTSTMHGDELGGYVVSLRMIDYLLTNYASNSMVQHLLNSCEIWINPLANPDGTYLGGNHTVSGSIRYNANYIDLNRNFPDPAAGQNPDANARQTETQLMMDFADAHHFSLSLNIHSGAEVVNYPWDTWSRPTADDEWWKYVGGNYRDSAQANSPIAYLNDINNGLTLGYDWYIITGGRQDFMNYFKNCREFTLEISSEKKYPSENLPNLWNWNKTALFGYFYEALNGIHGKLTNAHGMPLYAEIQIQNHDKDNSQVFTEPSTGYFFRFLKAGTYDLQIIAEGYTTKVFKNIVITDGEKKDLQFVLCDSLSIICLQDSLIKKTIVANDFDSLKTTIINCGNDTVNFSVEIGEASNFQWVTIENSNYTLMPNSDQQITLFFNPDETEKGNYSTSLHIISDSAYSIPLFLKVENNGLLQFSDSACTIEALKGQEKIDSIYLKNNFFVAQNFRFALEKTWNWFTIENSQGALNAGDSMAIILKTDAQIAPMGFYENTLYDTLGNNLKFPIQVFIYGESKLKACPIFINTKYPNHDIFYDTIVLSNNGGETINFEAYFETNESWIGVQPTSGSLLKNEIMELIISSNTNNQAIGQYNHQLFIETENEKIEIPVFIEIDSLPKLKILTSNVNLDLAIGQLNGSSVAIKNVGGGLLNYEVSANDNWIQFAENSGQIKSQLSKNIAFIIDSKGLLAGNYSSKIFINEEFISIEIRVTVGAELSFSPKVFYYEIYNSDEISDSITLTNSGGQTLNYKLEVEESEQNNWMQLNSFSSVLQIGESKTTVFKINPSLLSQGTYKCYLKATATHETKIPLELKIK
ncbi:MAG: carboxypeptidase regulatory-like domain-containing protein [Salinivirgaceae bacterium]|nr:carboxypeptidase regulatory-like domain-containing protein [Salinivirgaceae bacterium]